MHNMPKCPFKSENDKNQLLFSFEFIFMAIQTKLRKLNFNINPIKDLGDLNLCVCVKIKAFRIYYQLS